MGMFAGMLSGLGEQVHQKHLRDWAVETEANRQLANHLEEMSKTAFPDFAQKLQSAAFALRTTPPGKKPPKWATDVQDLMRSHLNDQVSSGKANVQLPAGAGEQPGSGPIVSLATQQNPDQSMGANGPVSRAPGPPEGLAGLAASLPQPPPAQGAAPQAGGAPQFSALPTQTPSFASSPPAVSGDPSPGFNNINAAALPPPPPKEGVYTGEDGQTYQNYAPLPADLARRTVTAETEKAKATQQAELDRLMSYAKYQKQLDQDQIDRRVNAMKSQIDPATGKSVWDLLSPRGKAEALSGAKDITPERAAQAIAGTRSADEAPEGTIDVDGNPVTRGNGKQYRIRVLPDGTQEWHPVVSQTGHFRMPSKTSSTGWSEVYVDRTGKVVGEVPNMQPDPAYAPVVRNGVTSHVVDFGDHKELIPISSMQTTQRQIPGLPTPPPTEGATTEAAPAKPAASVSAPAATTGVGGGRNLGRKTLTPNQLMTADGKEKAFEQTIDLVKNVQSALPLLNSLIDAKKIEFQIDPTQGTIKSLVNRDVKLTPDEARLAADFASLTEHINVLRLPLGAGGFRGHEAFSALQQQRGQLSANPQVTAGILANTLKTLESQRDVLLNGMKPGGSGIAPPPAKKLEPPPAQNAAPPEVEKALASHGPGHYTLSDNSKWIKGFDGKITKE